MDVGVPKETLALMGFCYFPFELLFPFVIGRQTSGPDAKPFGMFLAVI
jgi:hypothetical protein